ncbi:hypothetical protein [Streptomyces sp. NPDC056165]|uniref:hypothetical protein n=1 Tax=Streptomyces sp. NPDC056165 TaxID=3345733 RepID=UPI0035E2D1C2
MGPMEVIARRAAGKCVGCNHDVHPVDMCRVPEEDASKALEPGICGCQLGVEDLLILNEQGL